MCASARSSVKKTAAPSAVPAEAEIKGIHLYFYVFIELELIQTQMTQKPMLRAEVYARALRASPNRKEDCV
jgi:hypothetical protein